MPSRAPSPSPLVKRRSLAGIPTGRILWLPGALASTLDPARVTVALGDVTVFRHGRSGCVDPDAARAALTADEVRIQVDWARARPRGASGPAISPDYVKINADYHT